MGNPHARNANKWNKSPIDRILRPELMTLGVAVIPALLVLWGTSIGSHDTLAGLTEERSKDENTFKLGFAKTVIDAAPSLNDDGKAPAAFAGLYALVEDGNEQDRRILLTIGYTSSIPGVQIETAEIISSDKLCRKLSQRHEFLELLAAHGRISAAAQSSAALQRAKPATQQEAESVVASVPPPPLEAALEAAAAQSGASGWAYYGRVGSATALR